MVDIKLLLLPSNTQIHVTLCEQMINSSHIYPTPPLRQDMTQGQFLSGV